MLKEGVSDYCRESVTVKSLPGPSLEMSRSRNFHKHSVVNVIAKSARARKKRVHARRSLPARDRQAFFQVIDKGDCVVNVPAADKERDGYQMAVRVHMPLASSPVYKASRDWHC
jgi:hypothetical protein